MPQKRKPVSRKRSLKAAAPKTKARPKKKSAPAKKRAAGKRPAPAKKRAASKRPAPATRAPTRSAKSRAGRSRPPVQQAREREEPETLIPGAADDDLAEELGEEAIEAATSGQQPAEENLNAEVPEETGGPFVETSAATEFARGTDASNPADAERAPFPTTGRRG